MRLKKCPNGHFYDEEKYGSCPHCAGTSSLTEPARPAGPEDERTEAIYGIDSSVTAPVPGLAGGSGAGSGSRPEMDELPTAPLAEPVDLGGNDDEGKTIGFFDPAIGGAAAMEDAPSKPGPEAAKPKHVDPVVGWLVCIEGAGYGKSYELHVGKNFIGRNAAFDINLEGDMAVSRDIHATLVYEPKQRMFFTMPGESHSLFYVNEDVVLGSLQLKAKDVLEIGQTKLVFIPFCDETFGWGA